MSHRKWIVTKQHPSRATSGHQLSCSLVSSISCATYCLVAQYMMDAVRVRGSGKTSEKSSLSLLDKSQIITHLNLRGHKVIVISNPQPTHVCWCFLLTWRQIALSPHLWSDTLFWYIPCLIWLLRIFNLTLLDWVSYFFPYYTYSDF